MPKSKEPKFTPQLIPAVSKGIKMQKLYGGKPNFSGAAETFKVKKKVLEDDYNKMLEMLDVIHAQTLENLEEAEDPMTPEEREAFYKQESALWKA